MQILIKSLYSLYNQLNKLKYNNELPEIMITIQSSPKSRTSQILGWCSSIPIWCIFNKDNEEEKQFQYEINIVAEALNRTFEEIVCTLLHEICHLSNSVKNINDCSRNGIHNEHFKEEAERVGFLVEKGKHVGWSQTTPSEELKKEIEKLSCDKNVFNKYRITSQQPITKVTGL
jgi:hypothetical protein